MISKKIKEKLKEYLDYAIFLIITFTIAFAIAFLFFGLLPIHDCNEGIINYSCSLWGFKY